MNKPPAQGFTLTELMTTVAVLAVVLTVGVPNFRDMIQTNRMAAQANDFLSALNLARSEAIKRGTRVTLCKSANLSSCDTSSSGLWSQGWIIFVDDNNNATADDGPGSILRVHESLGSSTLSGNTILANYASYASNGFFDPVSGTFVGGAFMLCSGGTDSLARKIYLNTLGRAYVSKVSCS
jgi:type IV fimbrial biogenesis protein FimT